MPKRSDLKKICVIGSGPIVIGQACEFDYSGTQACKALRNEGYEVVLVNSNPASIMTDVDTADVSYIEPLTVDVLQTILHKERPCALLPTLGGQTALNLALELNEQGILEALSIEMLGALPHSIQVAEDRQAFKALMQDIGLEVAKSSIVNSIDQASFALEHVGLPAILRPSYTLGGVGGGIARTQEEFLEKVQWALDLSPVGEVLVEESLLGWKEFEMEVIRDQADRVIIICAIENLDPMGIHTGDSITVAPAQTLTDREYQEMRNASIDVIRAVGVTTGGSNIQFALDPESGRMVVIEMNPRVSRSSALASKATGFPIAKIAALLAVGYTLDELPNEITQTTTACFEPTLDYVITKIPRFAFEKFPHASTTLNTQMKSIGEVMAIASDFSSSLLKALRGLEAGSGSLLPTEQLVEIDLLALERLIRTPSPTRLLAVAEGIRRGLSTQILYKWSAIDPWFLNEIKSLVDTEQEIIGYQNAFHASRESMTISPSFFVLLKRWKQMGFADETLGQLLKIDALQLRNIRKDLGIKPVFKRVDTCAAEFEAYTPYLYATYESECEADVKNISNKVLIIGSGPNRIGQGIEFDYSCVKAAQSISQSDHYAIMLNSNPETVSTDHDISQRLFFEPIDLESVLDLIDLEQPKGVIVQFGGQRPLRMAKTLAEQGVQVLGTSPDVIEESEDRASFSRFAKKLALRLPKHFTVWNTDEAFEVVRQLSFPLLVRPSHVLGGRGMKIVKDEQEFAETVDLFFGKELDVRALPLLIDEFLADAIEVDVDLICDGQVALVGGVMEQVERAGAHSGDSACCLPAHSLSVDVCQQLKQLSKKIALELGVVGLLNIQYVITGTNYDEVYVIEVNPRASRTVPFVSKSVGTCLATLATQVMLGHSLNSLGYTQDFKPQGFFCKESVLPLSRFLGEYPTLRPEMRSTGEVMTQGVSAVQAYQRSQIATHNFPAALHDKKTLICWIDADLEGWKKVSRSGILNHSSYAVTWMSDESQQEFAHSFLNTESFEIIQWTQDPKAVQHSDIALLVYHQASKDQVTRFRTILSEKVAYFTTIEALLLLWQTAYTTWDPIALQHR